MKPRTCAAEGCNEDISHRRNNAKYCDRKCKDSESSKRKLAKRRSSKKNNTKTCEAEGCDKTFSPDRRNTKYCAHHNKQNATLCACGNRISVTSQRCMSCRSHGNIDLKCEECGKSFTRSLREHRKRTKQGIPPYCSTACGTQGGKRKGSHRRHLGHCAVTCEYCDKFFIISVAKYRKKLKQGVSIYCDSECANAGSAQKRAATRSLGNIELECLECSTVFTRTVRENNKRKSQGIPPYCSTECGTIAAVRKRSEKSNTTTVCTNCGCVFPIKQYKLNAIIDHGTGSTYCSHECSTKGKAKKATKRVESNRKIRDTRNICCDCGKRSQYHNNARRCRDCHNKYYRGINHHAYKGGRSTYPPGEWTVKVRRNYRIRDEDRCALCGKRDLSAHTDRNPPVHHINGNKQDCHPANIITLCISCHQGTVRRAEYAELSGNLGKNLYLRKKFYRTLYERNVKGALERLIELQGVGNGLDCQGTRSIASR